MKCPFCQHAKTGIIDSRSDKDNTRRRRRCLVCKRTFPTVEVLINAQQPSGQTTEDLRHLIKMSKVSLVVLKDYITKLERLTS